MDTHLFRSYNLNGNGSFQILNLSQVNHYLTLDIFMDMGRKSHSKQKYKKLKHQKGPFCRKSYKIALFCCVVPIQRSY